MKLNKFDKLALLAGAVAVTGAVFFPNKPAPSYGFAGVDKTPAVASAACSPDKFEIIDKTASVEKYSTTITAVVRNNNATACGFRLSTDLLDKDGHIVANDKGWPASVSNIAPGETYSFDVMFTGENRRRAEGGSFKLNPIEARAWR